MRDFMRLCALAVTCALLHVISQNELSAQSPSKAPVLSPDIPHDVVAKVSLGYSSLSASVQQPFDEFSWQSFVALNWPADPFGRPLRDSILTHAASPRVWEFYRTPQDVFDRGRNHPLG